MLKPRTGLTCRPATPTISSEQLATMTADSGGKPPSGSSPGRPAADTPQRLVVRGENDSIHGASDTAVAIDHGMDQTIDPSQGGSGAGLRQTPGDGSSKSGPTSTSEILNTTLAGRYLVTKKVGQGGMGAVYEATHTLIGKRVAVKVLLEKYAQREAIVARLKKEAQLASSIGNEHIIDITDIGNTDDGSTFVVMEYLDGESLAECLSREHTLPEQRMLRIASQASSALAAAHAKGIECPRVRAKSRRLAPRRGGQRPTPRSGWSCVRTTAAATRCSVRTTPRSPSRWTRARR